MILLPNYVGIIYDYFINHDIRIPINQDSMESKANGRPKHKWVSLGFTPGKFQSNTQLIPGRTWPTYPPKKRIVVGK